MGIYKEILPGNLRPNFFLLFFSICKMGDIMDVYKSLNINILAVMKNPEILKFVPDHLKCYLHSKMITSQNVSSEAQVKNFFIS